jgi:hypothetical protein
MDRKGRLLQDIKAGYLKGYEERTSTQKVICGLRFSFGENVVELYVDAQLHPTSVIANRISLQLCEGKMHSVLDMAPDKDTRQLLDELFFSQAWVKFQAEKTEWFDFRISHSKDHDLVGNINFALLDSFFSSWLCEDFCKPFNKST